ncbi:MAG TPA: T9SS type A sorting domain-containing protein [Bacteroidia bacterium]|jgi:hypothetical protein|nr:T9SS type A sorting domain-containing protein [Bacteroidia bacterium]
MKKLLLLTSVFSTTAFFAQITVTSTSMPVSGDTIRYSNVNPASVNVALTGPNYYWNYDTLISQSQGRYDYLKASLTSYAFYFLGTGQYGLKTADSIGAGTYKFYDVWNFYKKTTSVFEAEGIGFKYQNVPLAAYYSDMDEIYSLPLTYLRHDSTTFKFTVSLGGNIYYSQVGYRINNVDGWGTIKTPHDSVTCLRMTSFINEKDSINYNGIGFTFPNPQFQYKWMSTAAHIPILEVDGSYINSNFVPNRARYRDSYISTVGINEIKSNVNVTAFPNPTKDFIIIKADYAQPATVVLYDLNGKLLLKNNLTQGICVFDIRNFASQTCVYHLTNAEGKILQSGKIIIQK